MRKQWTRTAMSLAPGLVIAVLLLAPAEALAQRGAGSGDGPRTTVRVDYQGSTVYNSTKFRPVAGSTTPPHPEYQAVERVVFPIAVRLEYVEHELWTLWRDQIDDALSGWSHSASAPRFIRLSDAPTGTPIGTLPHGELKFTFAAIGGGQLQLMATLPGLTASAEVEIFPLANAQIDVTISQSVMAGTYDLLTGQLVLSAPQPPVVTVDADAGGILSFIVPGLLDWAVDEFAEDLQDEAQGTVNDLLEAKLAQYSTTVFGIEHFLPTNLISGNVDVDQLIRDFVTNIPAGNLLEVYFSRNVHLAGLEAGGTLHVKFGNIATLYLNYHKPLPPCYRPPGQPPPITCPQS